jgi:hypothetical protein
MTESVGEGNMRWKEAVKRFWKRVLNSLKNVNDFYYASLEAKLVKFYIQPVRNIW